MEGLYWTYGSFMDFLTYRPHICYFARKSRWAPFISHLQGPYNLPVHHATTRRGKEKTGRGIKSQININ